MVHPKGMRVRTWKLAHIGQLHCYNDEQRFILQLRHSTPTADDLLMPSFKVAAQLTPDEALSLASELLNWAAQRVKPEEVPSAESEP